MILTSIIVIVVVICLAGSVFGHIGFIGKERKPMSADWVAWVLLRNGMLIAMILYLWLDR